MKRSLTSGEIAMARLVFGDAIDYARVAIHAKGYLPFGLQHPNVVMAPNGAIYFGARLHRPDFSLEPPGWQVLFMHEMTHIWQFQLGYRLKMHGLRIALTGGYRGKRAYLYDSRRDETRDFSTFNMEQQGDLIAHYFGARHLRLAEYAGQLDFLEALLGDFKGQAKDRRLLPAPPAFTWRRRAQRVQN